MDPQFWANLAVGVAYVSTGFLAGYLLGKKQDDQPPPPEVGVFDQDAAEAYVIGNRRGAAR